MQRFYLSPVNIYRITQRLKYIEGNTNRQENIECLELFAKQITNRPENKIGIFEITKDS